MCSQLCDLGKSSNLSGPQLLLLKTWDCAPKSPPNQIPLVVVAVTLMLTLMTALSALFVEGTAPTQGSSAPSLQAEIPRSLPSKADGEQCQHAHPSYL